MADTFDPSIFDVASVSWTCAITSGTGSCAAPGPNSGDIATFVDLNASAVATFTVTAPILLSATGTIANTATATLTVGDDPNTANNSATDGDTVLAGFIELSSGTAGDAEDVGGNIPVLLIKGILSADQTIEVNVTGGTATVDEDFTHTAIVTIPAGTYDGTSGTAVAITLAITDDEVLEGDETIELTLHNKF